MKTEVIQINPELIEHEKIHKVASCVTSGGIVAFPTETVYGLAADASNAKALKRLSLLKKRTSNKPFTLQIDSIASLKKLGCDVPLSAHRLISTYWPGPLTLIFKVEEREVLHSSCRAKEGTLGVRIPDNAIALALLQEVHRPLAVPSANLSGEMPAKNAQEVLAHFDGAIEMVIDAGEVTLGEPSTIVDVREEPWKIVREGAIAREDILNV